ncbi:MAG: hypothetical protein ACI8VC_001932 [Candidatus Endobugula sp.]|jgi:hypothetical protein
MISVAREHVQEDDKSQYHKRKQVSRIIKHLTHQLRRQHLCEVPNDIFIDRWVHIALRHQYIEGDDWQKIIYLTLQAIHSHYKRGLLGNENDVDHYNSNGNSKVVSVDIFLLRLLRLTNSNTMYFR